MLRKTILIVYLIAGKISYSQQLKCELFNYLHHDINNQLLLIDNNVINVSLKKKSFFDLRLADSSAVFSSQSNEVRVRSKDDISYSIKLEGTAVFLINKNKTINLNSVIDTLTNINIKDEFVSSRKIGKTSFLNVVYINSKVDKIEILDLDRSISFWFSNFDNKPEIKKIKIEWVNTGNYLSLVYSIGQHPYLLDFYDAIKKGGIALFFKFQKDYFSSVLLYESLQDSKIETKNQFINDSISSKMTNTIVILEYDKNGVLKKKSKKKVDCS